MTATATAPIAADEFDGPSSARAEEEREQPLNPYLLPPATHHYLLRAAETLCEAVTTGDVPRRYACAHVAALQATAALLAARARPTPPASRRRQRNAWVLLAQVCPEMAEWADFFAAGAAKRAAAEAGSRRVVSEREADDLVRDSDRYLALVEEHLGMVPHAPIPRRLAVAHSGVA